MTQNSLVQSTLLSPELADALSAIITRIRRPDGTVPLTPAYDTHERTWNPPMPLLFQRPAGLEDRPIAIGSIRDLLTNALAGAGITGTDGKPLIFKPHDFRRIFTTDAILNGMPPHIAQLILGHHDINTTMGYKNSRELHQTGEEPAGQQLARLPGRRSGRPDASILTWEDLTTIPSDARFAHQGACIRREGQKRSDEGTRGFMAGVRVPGTVSGGFQYRTPPEAVYPQEAINGHRTFIARRRQLRPSEEYRSPSDTEWEEFLGHFQRRRVALGGCGRAYATSCIHEHSCIRCPMLRIDPAQRHRLEEIRDNLQARITEAEHEGWTGEAEGLRVSLDAANNKIAQADLTAARRAEHVNLGIPAYRDIATTLSTPGDHHDQ
jgi:hypothetical protein